jgi:cell division protein FtsB
MLSVKKIGMRFLLMIEMLLFGYLYFFGHNGIQLLQQQRAEVVALHNKIIQSRAQVEQLENAIYAWQTDDFYKEKIAREQLQMARKGDELFYVGV